MLTQDDDDQIIDLVKVGDVYMTAEDAAKQRGEQ
jgi:hypothetical protein